MPGRCPENKITEVEKMILADKIIALRKKNDWTQEELAEKVNVSRQSVSKWEGAQSVPDLAKILQLAEVFGVSTDYLLKDSLEEEEYVEPIGYVEEAKGTQVRWVSMEEASEFLKVKKNTAGKIALGVVLCILSPACLILLSAMSEVGMYGISEELAGGLGLTILLLMVVPAVALFVLSGSQTEEFDYLETEEFETEYGVTGMVKERQKQFKDSYTKNNVLGACLCILAALPLFVSSIFAEQNPVTEDVIYAVMLMFLFVLAAAGVYLFVRVGIPWESMKKLLQEGDYTRRKKKERKRSYSKKIGPVYWPVVTVIYLICLFLINPEEYNDYSWVVWPIAGVLYIAIVNLADGIWGGKNKE